MPGKTKIRTFLEEMAEDPSSWARLQQDPEGTMTAAGISKRDQAILLKGNPAQKRKVLGLGARSLLLLIIQFDK